MKNVFVNVKLSHLDFFGVRIGGAGLGNILFAWARGVVFAKKNNCKKINSTWSTIKLGTFLRKEKDRRTYYNIFKENYINGFMKVILLLFSKKINENQIDNLPKANKWPLVVNFSGMNNQMLDILEDYDIVIKEFNKIIRPKQLIIAQKNKPEAIAVHIRLGDFYIPKSETEIRKGKTNCRLPLNWYIAVIKNIRKELGYNVAVSVFSDGNDNDLKNLLDMENVVRPKGGSAISDMMSLSYAKILVASNSTFSLWASYIGQTNTIWFPGTHRVKLFNNRTIYEGEIDYNNNLPKELLTVIKKIN